MVGTLRTALLAAVLAGVGVQPALANAEGDPEEKPDPKPYRAQASRATPGTPEIDGELDEAAWALAELVTDFVQRDPEEGAPATERTEARVLFDDGSLYVGIRAYDSEPDKIIGQLTRRDQWSASDWLTVSIDSYYDRRTAFEFRVNPAGVERDMYRYDDTWADDSWNAVWDVATSVDEEGWVAEFRIPFSQLRFSQAAEQIWGFNIERVIQRKNEVVQWKPIAKDASGWVSEYGDLVGINGIQPPRRLEVLPYVVATQGYTPEDPDNPFQTGSEFQGNVGGDLRYGVTNSLTLNLTVNPDFGQVEADPSVVNLSAFETFFQEKRPFFLEGANIFSFGLSGSGGWEQLFYSRRIGRRPQGEADARDGYVDHPDNTTILAAAKLSGKSADGWTVGVLDAVTGKEKAAVIDGDGIRHADVVEPLTNYGVARVQKDFNGGSSAVGAIVTLTNRDLPASLDYLRSSAYAGGIDARHRFWDGNWELTGQVLMSHIRGSESAIDDAQVSSARYFQRPDASHLTYDPTRTSLSGTSGSFSFAKIGGGHWRGSVRSSWISPGFEVNDLGFQRSADAWRNGAWIQYRDVQPGKIFRRYYLNWNGWNHQTLGGERTATGMNVNGSFTLLSYWGGWGGVERQLPGLSIQTLRGGPAMKAPAAWNWWGGFYSDDRKPVAFETGTWGWKDEESSTSAGVWAFVAWRPLANVRLTLGPEYSWNHDDWQYLTTEDALGSTHYFTSVLDQKTLYLTTRLDWTFTPNLSLQLYAQPFVSAGTYTAFSEVVDPKADAYADRFAPLEEDRLTYEASTEPDEPGTYHVDLNRDGETDFSFDDPDFNFKQFRSTVVLRWEYMQGSTLFFVWSSSKTAYNYTGSFSPLNDFDALRQAEGENYFSIKVNYYLNP
ncbi:MAG: carbohydrate binding family 9 domain-containing protein [Gemmatimonadota bacterium]|nr:MAG: carbohydrate binding family 9 domain-containing protein [Gemmatimonadota bacterium]